MTSSATPKSKGKNEPGDLRWERPLMSPREIVSRRSFGDLAVMGLGVALNSGCTYIAFIVARRALGPSGYGSFAVIWALVTVAGAGLFHAIEQVIGRRQTGEVKTLGIPKGAVITLASTMVLLCGGWPLVGSALVDDHMLMLPALLLGLVGSFVLFVVRGHLGRGHEFRRYGSSMAFEGSSRLALIGALALLGIASPGLFAFGAMASLIAAALWSLRRSRGPRRGTPPVRLERAPYFSLAAASVSEAFVLNVGPIALAILSSDGGEAGRFFNAVVVARVPLLAFVIVRVSLLPRLALRAQTGDVVGFRRLVGAALIGVWGVVMLAALASGSVGPAVLERLFGDTVGSRDLVLLAIINCGAMVPLTLGLSLTAMGADRLVARGWIAGALAFITIVGMPGGLFLRVELSLLLSVVVVSVSLGLTLARLIKTINTAPDHAWLSPSLASAKTA